MSYQVVCMSDISRIRCRLISHFIIEYASFSAEMQPELRKLLTSYVTVVTMVNHGYNINKSIVYDRKFLKLNGQIPNTIIIILKTKNKYLKLESIYFKHTLYKL
jgi:hypothetical protein